jgi:hypothetical protein
MKSGYILLKVSVIAPILCTYDQKKGKNKIHGR